MKKDAGHSISKIGCPFFDNGGASKSGLAWNFGHRLRSRNISFDTPVISRYEYRIEGSMLGADNGPTI